MKQATLVVINYKHLKLEEYYGGSTTNDGLLAKVLKQA